MLKCTNQNYVNPNSPFAIIEFSNLILEYLLSNIKTYQQLVILCIGTDRSTGDSHDRLGRLLNWNLILPLTKKFIY